MKKTIVILTVFISIIILCSWTINNSGSPCDAPLVGGHTGAPGETSCAGCHAGTDNSGSATITYSIAGGVTQYIPGQVYSFTVSINQTGIDKMGFSCLALKNSNNTTIGNFQLTDAIRTRAYTDGPRNYVSHKPCAADVISLGFNEWSFNWQAPPTNEGNITIYLGALASNHNHATSGDFTYTRSLTLTPATVSGINAIEANKIAFSIFPNPISDVFEVSTPTETELTDFKIMDVNGRLVNNLSSELIVGKYTYSYSAKKLGLNSGVYFVKLGSNNSQSYKKLIVQ